MKMYTETLTLHIKKQREMVDITPQVKAALEKSGFQEGIILVASLHVNAGIFLNDEEPGLLQDLDEWLEKLAPFREDYKHRGKFESNASAHLKSLLVHPQVVVPFTQGKLDLGPWQQVFFAEFDGGRPKRVLVRVMGE